MRNLLIFLVSLALLATLTSCKSATNESESSQPSGSAQGQSGAEESQPESDTPVTSENNGDDNVAVIPATEIATVYSTEKEAYFTVGTPRVEVEAAFGEQEIAYVSTYTYDDFFDVEYDGDAISDILLCWFKDDEIKAVNSAWALPGGVKFGDSAQKIEDIFGEPDFVSEGALYYSTMLDGEEVTINFDFDDADRLNWYHIWL